MTTFKTLLLPPPLQSSENSPLSLFLAPFQVFLELSKEQELDDFDEHVDLSVKWKLLPHEEP